MLQHIHWHGSFPQLRKSVALTISLTRFPWTSDTAKLPEDLFKERSCDGGDDVASTAKSLSEEQPKSVAVNLNC
jgi:hypothetical protein